MFGCNNDRLFPEKYTVKDYISNTKLEKGNEDLLSQERISGGLGVWGTVVITTGKIKSVLKAFFTRTLN